MTLAFSCVTCRVKGLQYCFSEVAALLSSARLLALPHGGFSEFGLAAQQSTCRSEEHTSELQSLMRISYAVFCLKKKNKNKKYIVHNLKNRRQSNTTASTTQYNYNRTRTYPARVTPETQ